jgi:hypothetical protein
MPRNSTARLLGDDHGQPGAALLKLSLPVQQFSLLTREERLKADLRGNRPEDTGILCAWLQQGDHGQLVQGLLDHRLGDADLFGQRRYPVGRMLKHGEIHHLCHRTNSKCLKHAKLRHRSTPNPTFPVKVDGAIVRDPFSNKQHK